MTDPNTDWARPEGDGVPPALASRAATEPGPASFTAAAGTPAPVPVAAPRKKGGALTNVLLVVAALVAVGGVTFAIGRATAPAAAAGVFGRAGTGLPGQGAGVPGAGVPGGSFDPALGGPAGRGGFGDRTMTVSGTVDGIDGTTMTITTADGTSMTIDVSESTYHAQAAAAAGDVTAGTSVTVAIDGFGGMGRPDVSPAPDASAAAGAPTATVKASDVTITSE